MRRKGPYTGPPAAPQAGPSGAAAASAGPERKRYDRRGPLRGDKASHRSKFFLLFYPGRGVRFVVLSANMIPIDGGILTNSIWFQVMPSLCLPYNDLSL